MEENLKNYKTELLSLLDKSNDAFEKQINYISAGAIGVSMIMVENIIQDVSKSSCKPLLITSWSLFILTLLGNLLSHIYTFSIHSKTIAEIDAEQYNYKIAKRRNDSIKKWNLTSASLLVSGVVFLILYISINLYTMSKDKETKPAPQPGETRGMPASQPPKPNTGSPSSSPPQQPINNPKK